MVRGGIGSLGGDTSAAIGAIGGGLAGGLGSRPWHVPAPSGAFTPSTLGWWQAQASATLEEIQPTRRGITILQRSYDWATSVANWETARDVAEIITLRRAELAALERQLDYILRVIGRLLL